jgi:hypothetical protein
MTDNPISNPNIYRKYHQLQIDRVYHFSAVMGGYYNSRMDFTCDYLLNSSTKTYCKSNTFIFKQRKHIASDDQCVVTCSRCNYFSTLAYRANVYVALEIATIKIVI